MSKAKKQEVVVSSEPVVTTVGIVQLPNQGPHSWAVVTVESQGDTILKRTYTPIDAKEYTFLEAKLEFQRKVLDANSNL